MFETFNSPAMYVAIQAVLSLYASGRTTGIVLGLWRWRQPYRPDLRGLRSAPCHPGAWTWPAVIWPITWWRSWPSVATASRPPPNVRSSVTSRRSCATLPWTSSRKWQLLLLHPPWRRATSCLMVSVITIGNERFRCPRRPCCNPASWEMESCGIHETTFNSIMKCDVDIRKDLIR